MEQRCDICGFSEENSEQLINKQFLQICEICLKEEKVKPLLDQLFL
jgi:hypothetical protein